MAKMIPLMLRDEEYLSESEKEVFTALKNGLNDEWVVIYSLRWITEDDISLNKSNGESDFTIIHPNYGIMILEVKGGIINCSNGEWSSIARDNTKRPIKDPEKQANDAKYNLKCRFNKEKINPYITTAVWFPDCIKEKCTLPLSMNKNILLDMNSFNKIEESIIDIFEYRIKKESFVINKLLESEYNKVLNILNPKVDVKIPMVKLANNLNMKFIKLNEEQNLFFEQLDENKFITIKGHAGTGKTVLGVKKAFRESEAGKKVLFLCYNSLLKEDIQKQSNGEFDVFTFSSFALEYIEQYNEEANNRFNDTFCFDDMHSDFIKEAKNNKKENRLIYDSIIIDEGQDFTEEWLNTVLEFLADDGSICVFYDEHQMLYNKYGRNDISFLDRGTKFVLKRNMRNTDQICMSCLNVIDVNKNSIRLNGVVGENPDLFFLEDSFDTITYLKNVIRDLKKNEYLKDENITVLTMESKKKLKIKKGIADEFSGTTDSIRRFKGLESDIVIIPDLNSNFIEDEDLKKLLYVGMSRAKAHVILIINTETLNRKQRVEYKKKVKEMLYSFN